MKLYYTKNRTALRKAEVGIIKANIKIRHNEKYEFIVFGSLKRVVKKTMLLHLFMMYTTGNSNAYNNLIVAFDLKRPA